MGLEIKQAFLGQDKSGRSIDIKDATGLESQGVVTGYGSSNGTPESILAYHIVASRMLDSISYYLKIDGTNEYLPKPVNLGYGHTLTLTTNLFKKTTSTGVMEPWGLFKDGVLDLSMYVEFIGQSGVVIQKGTNYITGGSFTRELKADAVIVDGKIYQIDKSMYSNGNTIIYVTGSFDVDATSFNILYRSNMKVLLQSITRNLHAYACKTMRDDIKSPEWNQINTALSFLRASEGFFKSEDYSEANGLTTSSFLLLAKYAYDNCRK